jgi:D-glycero-alpha-D-manno-heptose-7-phosphate kinase
MSRFSITEKSGAGDEGPCCTPRECLQACQFDDFGSLLHRGWECKKRLASRITNGAIEMYEAARKAGALGGMITGARGGGFLLLCVPKHPQDDVRRTLRHLRAAL